MLIFMMIFIFTVVYYRKHFNIKVYNNTNQLYKLLMKVDELENNKLNKMIWITRKLDENLYIELSQDFYQKEKELDLLLFKYSIYRFDYDNFYNKVYNANVKMYVNIMRKNAFKK